MAQGSGFTEKLRSISSAKRSTFVMGVGIALSFILAVFVDQQVENRKSEHLHDEFEKLVRDFEQAIEMYKHPLEGIAGLMAANDYKTSSDQFRKAARARHNYSNFAGTLGFGFIRLVKKSEIPKFLAAKKRERPAFGLRRISQELDDPNRPKEHLYVIEMVEPAEANARAVGLVISDEERRREAAQEAWRSGKVTLTRSIQLVQADQSEPGFLLLMPVYRQDAISNLSQDAASHLVGWAYTPLLARGLGEFVVRQNPNNHPFMVREFDPEAGQRIIYASSKEAALISPLLVKRINLAGRDWEISLLPHTNWIGPRIHFESIFAGVLVLGLALLIVFYFRGMDVAIESATSSLKVKTNALESALELNNAVNRSAKFSIITTNLNGLITGFNREAENILGYRAEEMVGKFSPAVFHDPAEVAEAAAQLSRDYNVDVPVGFDTFVFKAKLGFYDERRWTYVSKTGKRIPVRLIVTGLYDSKGELFGFMGIARDLSDYVTLESQLSQARVKATHNAKLASLGQLAAGVAHEINNPLAIVEGNLKLLNRILDQPDKLKAKIETIIKATARISKIVGGLKKFSRSGDSVAHRVHCLSAIVREAIALTDHKSKRHMTPLDFACHSEAAILCDEIEIEQVLVNLINNGIDAIKEHKEKWVKIELFENASQVVLRVIDSGPGIPDEIRDQLFQPFFTTKEVGEGTGLGLSISKGILDEHKATIEVLKDMPNSCFEIRFPRADKKESVA